MTDRELMQMALDALEEAKEDVMDWGSYASEYFKTKHGLAQDILALENISEALRARLAQPEQEPVATLFGSLPVYDVPPEQEPMACIVKGCSNQRHKGKFVGDLCSPCATFITTGEGKYSQAYRNSQREWQGLTDEEIREIVGVTSADSDWNVRIVHKWIRDIEQALREKNHG